jgi:hypothetical protein
MNHSTKSLSEKQTIDVIAIAINSEDFLVLILVWVVVPAILASHVDTVIFNRTTQPSRYFIATTLFRRVSASCEDAKLKVKSAMLLSMKKYFLTRPKCKRNLHRMQNLERTFESVCSHFLLETRESTAMSHKRRTRTTFSSCNVE